MQGGSARAAAGERGPHFPPAEKSEIASGPAPAEGAVPGTAAGADAAGCDRPDHVQPCGLAAAGVGQSPACGRSGRRHDADAVASAASLPDRRGTAAIARTNSIAKTGTSTQKFVWRFLFYSSRAF